MMDPNLLISFSFLFFGLIIGGLCAWLIAKLRFQANSVNKADLAENYVVKALHDNLNQQLQQSQQENEVLHTNLEQLQIQLATKTQILNNLEEQLLTQKQEVFRLQDQFQIQFENIANRLLEEKSQKFSLQNQQQLQSILSPLKDQIKVFEEGIEKRFWQETKDRISLKKEIEHLRELNLQLSQEANNLASALKGEKKTQGDWGELQLERLLEKAGLNKNIHYKVQPSFHDELGKLKRPDCIIFLPEEKHLIIDSKVSLSAYEQFFNADRPKKQEKFLKIHVDNIRNHLKDLSKKNYQQLYEVNAPDYLLMFVPIEPAFAVAMQHDPQLFTDALDKNIVIVTTSTLLATMRTVAYIWKQEKQKKSVMEIARQSGLLYDKFCNFIEDLKGIGSRLDAAQDAYQEAMKKLVESRKYGDTLVGRAEKIKALGAKTSKALPADLLDQLPENGDTEAS